MTAPVMPPVRAPSAPDVPPPPPHRGAAPGRLLLGGLLVALGLVWLAERLDLVDLRWQTALSVAVVLVGLAVLATAPSGRTSGLIPLGVALAALLVLVATLPAMPLAAGAGDRDYRPLTVAELPERYELGAGGLRLDLTGLELPRGDTAVAVHVGLGEISVLVPTGPAVEVRADAGAGELRVLGVLREGVSPSLRHEETGTVDARLVLDLSVGLGAVEVTR